MPPQEIDMTSIPRLVPLLRSAAASRSRTSKRRFADEAFGSEAPPDDAAAERRGNDEGDHGSQDHEQRYWRDWRRVTDGLSN